MTKFVFVTRCGVLLGKGIASASLAAILITDCHREAETAKAHRG